MSTSPSKKSRRRWALAITITLFAAGAVGIGVLFIVLRPPISDTRVERIVERLEGLAHRVPLTPEEDVSPRVRAILATFRQALSTWEVESESSLQDLSGEHAPPADSPAWTQLERRFQPTFDALDTLPMSGRVPRRTLDGTRPIPSHDLIRLVNVIKAVGRGYEIQGRYSDLVPLANRVLFFTRIRDEDTPIGFFIGSELIGDATRLATLGIPHASVADLERLRDELRYATVVPTEFDRPLAFESMTAFDYVRGAAKNPSLLAVLETPGLVHGSGLYLKYQLALTAKRWGGLFDLPRDEGWYRLGTAMGAYAAELNHDPPDWRSELADLAWSQYQGLVFGIASHQSTGLALRVAVAAELHRREHGAYPANLDPLAERLDRSRGWVPPDDSLHVVGTSDSCRVQLNSPNFPVKIELSSKK